MSTKRTSRFLLAASVLLVAGAPAPAAEPHPFSIHDMVAMERVSDAQVSPDGARVVFTLRTTDLENDRGRTDLWMVALDGSAPRRLTSHPDADHQPRWHPDGSSVWFLSSRGGSSQVWRIARDGGEAAPVTALPLDVSSFALSPDGKRLAVSLDVFPDCASLACTEARLKEKEDSPVSARVYDRLLYRHWDTWKDGRRSHLFVLNADGSEPVDVMRGMDADCPSKPFGGPEEYTFSPDGTELVFSARDAGEREAWSTDFDLYRAPVDGSARPRDLTAANEAWDTSPVFSPDGKTLAYLAMAEPGYESDRRRIVLRGWPDGEPRVLTEEWDRSPGALVWSERGDTLWAVAQDLGRRSLFSIDARSGRVERILADGTVRSVAPIGGGRLLVARDHLRSPVELYTMRRDGSRLEPVTHVNDARLAEARMGETEQFRFEGAGGDEVWAWVVKPAGFEPRKRYPVAFLIHGGPQGSFGDNFHYRWNPQAYAGAGFAAVMVDFHGSTGYGQAFTDSIQGDWGGKPLVDLRKGLAAALERYPWMDGDRVCALGASFGGYMINWIAGQWPDRFRCLVNHDGNLDERLAYFDTEELWFPERDHMGTPWTNPQGYSKHNPILHVDKWKTPMLVIHGALDYRVVDTQGMSTFTALQRQGIPSRFVYFPDENHWVLKPHNSIFWHDTVIDWLRKWTR